MRSLTTGSLTWRWDGNNIVITSPEGQHRLSADESFSLLVWLYDDLRQAIFEARDGVPEWARSYQPQPPLLEPGQRVQVYEEGKE